MIVAVFLAYIRVFPGLSTSQGIIPDIRYLSPAYIPIGLLGTVSLFTLLDREPVKELFKKYLIIAIVLVPATILALLLFHPFGGLYLGFSLFFMLAVYSFIALVFAGWLGWRYGIVPFRYLVLATRILLAIPLAWQMMMVFLYSAEKYNHYPFWVPIVEQWLQHLHPGEQRRVGSITEDIRVIRRSTEMRNSYPRTPPVSTLPANYKPYHHNIRLLYGSQPGPGRPYHLLGIG